MDPLSANIDQIRLLCDKYHVTALYAFGSVTRGELKPDSDIDLMVEIQNDNLKDTIKDFIFNNYAKKSIRNRKIRNYLYGILEDAWKYSHDKRPGRRKKQTK